VVAHPAYDAHAFARSERSHRLGHVFLSLFVRQRIRSKPRPLYPCCWYPTVDTKTSNEAMEQAHRTHPFSASSFTLESRSALA
jgi:hypothetical protein